MLILPELLKGKCSSPEAHFHEYAINRELLFLHRANEISSG